jgi:hypothetical protein
MPKRSSKPRDVNRLARAIVDQATGTERQKNPAAVELGRLGGRKGGLARAATLSAGKRREIARKAAKARWAALGAPRKAKGKRKNT